MSKNVGALPDTMLRRMTAADRKAIGQMTAEEAAYAYRKKLERYQHNIYINWLNQQEWFLNNGIFFHDNPTHRRTGHRGDPDFQVCYLGASLWLEFKTETGRLSGEQLDCHIRMLRAGHIVYIPTSALEAINITKKWRLRIEAQAARLLSPVTT